jgi:flagellin-like hook-associated protein FlgL
MITGNAINHMSDSLEQLHALQEKVATQKKFSSASDDPVGASLSLSLKSSLQSIEDYERTSDFSNDWMSANENAFQKMEDLGIRANNLILSGLNDTNGVDERAIALAEDLNGLIREAVDTANTSHNGQYIFAGVKTGQPIAPYTIPDNTNPSPTLSPEYVAPAGTPIDGVMQRTIGPAKTVTINYHADDVFGAFFTALTDARNALKANDTGGLRTALGALQSSINTIDQTRTLNGTRLRQVEVAQEYLAKTKIETQSLISQNEDINLAEGISLLQNQETTYKVVLEVSQRAISTMNLFDYLSS